MDGRCAVSYLRTNCQKDYLTLADFARLRKANDLIKKWYDRFQIEKKYFMPFLCDLQKNFQKYYDMLPVNYRGTFKKDYKEMFYAAEVENALVEQFVPMVISILKRLHVESQFHETLFVDGMLSVRNSVWKFKTHKNKASFFSYAYNGCLTRIWSRRSKLRKESKAKRNKIAIFNESDICKSLSNSVGINKINDPRSQTPEEIVINRFDYDVDALFERAELSEDEKKLIKIYMTRKDHGNENWSAIYRRDNKKPDGTEMSRQAVDNRIVYIQYKLWQVYSKENGMEFKDSKIRCVSRVAKIGVKNLLASRNRK